MNRFAKTAVTLGAAAWLVLGTGAAFAQDPATGNQVSGRGYGPGVEIPTNVPSDAAAPSVVQGGASAPSTVLGEQAHAAPVALPRTGGLGGTELIATVLTGLTFTAAGLRLTRRGNS